MTLETANPIIVLAILLPFVICCLGLIAGVLNHWWKHKEGDENTASVCYWCRKNPCECKKKGTESE